MLCSQPTLERGMTLASAFLAHCDAVRSVSSGIRRRTTAFSAHIRHRVYALSCEERAFLGRAAAAAEELLRCNDAALEVAACEAEKAYALFQDDAKTEEASVRRVGHKAIEWDRYLHNIEEDPGEGCKVVTGGFRCNATGCFAAAVSQAPPSAKFTVRCMRGLLTQYDQSASSRAACLTSALSGEGCAHIGTAG